MPILLVNEDPALYTKLASNVGYARTQAQLRHEAQVQFEQQQQDKYRQDALAQNDNHFQASNELAREQVQQRGDIADAANATRESIASGRGDTLIDRANIAGQTARDVAQIRNDGSLDVADVNGQNRLNVVGQQQQGANLRNQSSIDARAIEGNLNRGVRVDEGDANRQLRSDLAGQHHPAVKTPAQLTKMYLGNAQALMQLGDVEGAHYWIGLANQLRSAPQAPQQPASPAAPQYANPRIVPAGAGPAPADSMLPTDQPMTAPPQPPAAPLSPQVGPPAAGPAKYQDGDSRVIQGIRYVRVGGNWVAQ